MSKGNNLCFSYSREIREIICVQVRMLYLVVSSVYLLLLVVDFEGQNIKNL